MNANFFLPGGKVFIFIYLYLSMARRSSKISKLGEIIRKLESWGYENEVSESVVRQAIAVTCGVSNATIHHYLKLLQEFGILRRIPFSKSFRIRKDALSRFFEEGEGSEERSKGEA